MNREIISDALNEIREDYIEESAEVGIMKILRKKWVKWIPVAASLCLLIGGMAVWRNGSLLHADRISQNVVENSSMEGLTGESMVSSAAIATDYGTGVEIPAIKLPKTTNGVQMDMIGCVVYHGGIYTQTAFYWDDEAVEIESLVDEYLGFASGTIDEWSTKDEYQKELAGSIYGDIYSVEGYDTDFRVCWRQESVDADGNPSLCIQFLERLNGITLNTGSDLFEDRLMVRDRVSKFSCQSHEDWNHNANGEIQEIGIDGSLWENFLEELDQGRFIYVYNSDREFYRNSNQAHLYLTMDDKTTVRLRLFEGGYVGYEGLGWYFVRIPGEAFDAVYALCGGE